MTDTALFLVGVALLLVVAYAPDLRDWWLTRRARRVYTHDQVEAIMEACDRRGYARASAHYESIIRGMAVVHALSSQDEAVKPGRVLS